MSLVRDLRGANGNGHPTHEIPIPSPVGLVSIRHPAYPVDSDENVIMWLPSLDLDPQSRPARFGFHCGTLMSICYIISGNKPGFLSSTMIQSDNKEALATMPASMPAFDAILTEKDYYYYIAGAKLGEQYNVLSKFSDWQFPNIRILNNYHYWTHWTHLFDAPPVRGPFKLTSDMSKIIRDRDQRCKLTGVPEHCGCDAAHIIPKEQGDWFKANKMKLYSKGFVCGNNDPTAYAANMCTLHCDIHRMFKKNCFTFVPKQNHLVVQFFDPEALDAGRFVHNCSLESQERFSAEYFFARLGLLVLPLTIAFTGQLPNKRKRKQSLLASAEGSRNTRSKPNTNNIISPDSSHQDDVTRPPRLSGQVDDTIDEARELAEDNEIAMSFLPHVFGAKLSDSGSDNNLELPQSVKDQKARARSLYHTLYWYPGLDRTERIKKAYMDAHPEVRAMSADGDAVPVPNGME